MPLIRLLLIVVPIARRLLRNPKVRAKLGLSTRGDDGSTARPRRR